VSVPARRDASRAAAHDASPEYSRDACAWCRNPIPEDARSDSITCSQRCRQARWRFNRQVEQLEAAAQPKRLAIADPPYPGLAFYYRDHVDYGGEVDHASLLQELDAYDGWALCTSAQALPAVLSLASSYDGWRVAAWVRGSRAGESTGPLSSWEPVVYKPARSVVSGDQPDDALVFTARPRTTDPRRVIGAKPAAFASWVFQLLAARQGDELDDLFPGSGGIGRAWRAACATG